MSSLPAAIDPIWARWGPDCGLPVAHGEPCFERYTLEFASYPGLGGMEVWVPLEA